MFYSPRVRWTMTSFDQDRSEARNEEQRASPRFEVPLFVRNTRGEFVEHHGRLGISGFYYESNAIPIVGQTIDVRVVLLGLGLEVEARGRVIEVISGSNHVGIAACFEQIPFETERMIARWLDLLVKAHQTAAAA